MKILFATTFVLALTASQLLPAEAGLNQLTPGEKTAGWQLLFDGKTLNGWRGYRLKGLPEAGWAIESGLLKTVPGVKGVELITERQFDNFEFGWDWRVAPGANNGVKYLVTEARPQAPGIEYQMIDDEKNADAARGATHMTAAFHDVLPPTDQKPVKPAGEWNSSRILIQGDHVEHWLNGVKVLAYELGSEQVKAGVAASKFKKFPDFGTKIKGHLMLTYHHDECWYRNVKIRELPAK